MNNIYQTPEPYILKTNHYYPPANTMVFEDYFLQRFRLENPQTNRMYLPVQWTCKYIHDNSFDKDKRDMNLQKFLDLVDRGKKYFTVVQWDDGILHDLDGLDIKIFASGGVGDYPIPLICTSYEHIEKPKDIFASFVGVILGRGNGIRFDIQQAVSHLNDYKISEITNFDDFKDTMARSIFSLCPRGYGKTSFRICESLNLGSIPVYIYDDPWIPFNDILDFNSYGVLVHKKETYKIDEILRAITTEKIDQLRETGKHVYKNYYTYEGCYDRILEILFKENV